jgi:flagellar export protein FliJ
MGFQFSLDAVLQVREIVEEQEERILQKILHGIVRAREALAQTEARITESDAVRSANCFKPVVGYNIHAAYGELKELKQNRKNFEEKIGKLEELRDKQLIAYSEARQNREVLSTMCEKKRKAYELDMTHIEQKALDDIFISRRKRN